MKSVVLELELEVLGELHVQADDEITPAHVGKAAIWVHVVEAQMGVNPPLEVVGRLHAPPELPLLPPPRAQATRGGHLGEQAESRQVQFGLEAVALQCGVGRRAQTVVVEGIARAPGFSVASTRTLAVIDLEVFSSSSKDSPLPARHSPPGCRSSRPAPDHPSHGPRCPSAPGVEEKPRHDRSFLLRLAASFDRQEGGLGGMDLVEHAEGVNIFPKRSFSLSERAYSQNRTPWPG